MARQALGCAADHPRLRGEHTGSSTQRPWWAGSPPPARGARDDGGVGGDFRRITPACAGSTWSAASRPGLSTDHPRLRGEHRCSAVSTPRRYGSPPPARGARFPEVEIWAGQRITPACAGSTHWLRSISAKWSDHPRLRGEHDADSRRARNAAGSPPPARGARGRADGRRGDHRITPACAGSTDPADGHRACSPDHPRLRGEHAMATQ